MESLRRVQREVQRVFQTSPAGTRFAAASAVVVGVAVVCGLILRSSSRSLVPLAEGAGFSEAESAVIRTAISAAGLPEPVQRDGQLLVPESDRDRYRATIQDAAGAPSTWAESWEEANSALSRFSLSAEREDIEEITRAKLTSRLLNELPGIEQADVVWDEERQPGWNRPPLVHATVYLRPRAGGRITLETVHAVRLAVAGSKAYLAPEDVVVMDLSTMVAFDHESLGADFTARYGRMTRLTTEYRQRAEEALSHIPGAAVAVAVERIIGDRPDGTDEFVPPPQSEPVLTSADVPRATFHQGSPNTGLEISIQPPLIVPVDLEVTSAAANIERPTPGQHVTVSVSIPSTHYRQTAAARRLLPAPTPEEAARVLAAIEQEVMADVRTRLARIETQVDPRHGQPTVLVQSIEIDAVPIELLVAQPVLTESPATATIFARSRGALIGVTALMACWLIWSVVRMFAAKGAFPPPVTRPTSPQSLPENSHEAGHSQHAARAAFENAPDSVSEIPADQLKDVLNGDHDEFVMKRIVRPLDRESGAGRDATQTGAHDRARGCLDVEHWDIDELAGLPDAQLRRLVRSVAIDMWPAALSPAAPVTRRRLLSALPDGEAEQLREVLDHVRPLRLDEIDQAQREVQTALFAC